MRPCVYAKRVWPHGKPGPLRLDDGGARVGTVIAAGWRRPSTRPVQSSPLTGSPMNPDAGSFDPSSCRLPQGDQGRGARETVALASKTRRQLRQPPRRRTMDEARRDRPSGRHRKPRTHDRRRNHRRWRHAWSHSSHGHPPRRPARSCSAFSAGSAESSARCRSDTAPAIAPSPRSSKPSSSHVACYCCFSGCFTSASWRPPS